MNLKRFISVLLAFIMLFALCACQEADNDESNSSKTESQASSAQSQAEYSLEVEIDNDDRECSVTPAFWKATDKDGDVIWLFGSIHVGKEEFYPLPEAVTDAFKQSEAIAVEFDMIAFENDMSAAVEALKIMVYSDGSKISDHIPKELYDDAVKLLTDAGVYNALYDYYQPSLWMSLISNLSLDKIGLDAKYGIDNCLLLTAKSENKEILEIESAKEQYKMLASFSEELQIALLEDAVALEKAGESANETIELAKAWEKGNIEELTEMLSVPDDIELTDIESEYWDAMMTKRNNKMTDFCVKSLKEGKEVFVVVGLAHFLGEDGIVNQLVELGYTVEEID